jgi:cytochrome c556
MTRLARLALIFAGLATAGAALAASTGPERAIKYRQNVYGLIGWNFGALGQMARGQRDFDATEFARRAERVAQLSMMLDEGFPPGSDKGAKTEALPAIWTNRADFDAKLADFQREAAALAKVAAGGDADATKAQFAKTAGTCKACHDKYKAD